MPPEPGVGSTAAPPQVQARALWSGHDIPPECVRNCPHYRSGGRAITQLIQWHLKDKETRSLAFAEYLKNEEKVSNDAFVMIGKASAAAEDMA